jgi:hypothetical protein
MKLEWEVPRERQGYRDLGWSLRQRLYGYNTPFCNIDCAAYSNHTLKALIEDKHENEGASDVTARVLGNFQYLPTFMRYHTHDFSQMMVIPLNELGNSAVEPNGGWKVWHSEIDHFLWSRQIRGIKGETADFAQRIMDKCRENACDKPLKRAVILTNMDNQHTIDKDIGNLSEEDAERIQAALDKRKKACGTAICRGRKESAS